MYLGAKRFLAMQRYGGGSLYATLLLHIQRSCFQIWTHDQSVTKAQLNYCTRARPTTTDYCPLSFSALVAARICQWSLQQVKPYSKFTVNLIDPLEWLWMVQHNLHVLELVCIMPFEEIENWWVVWVWMPQISLLLNLSTRSYHMIYFYCQSQK